MPFHEVVSALPGATVKVSRHEATAVELLFLVVVLRQTPVSQVDSPGTVRPEPEVSAGVGGVRLGEALVPWSIRSRLISDSNKALLPGLIGC